MDFGKFLRDNDITGVDVANYLNISTPSVSKWKTGKAVPSNENMAMLVNNPFGWDTEALTNVTPTISAKATGNARNRITITTNTNIGQPSNLIPLIPLEAHAGTLQEYAEGVSLYQCEMIASPIPRATCAIRVLGDSMSGKIETGSILFLSKVNMQVGLEWGRTYVLDTDNGAVCKIVRKSDKEGEIICESANPDYPPYELKLIHINGAYRVIGVLTYI